MLPQPAQDHLAGVVGQDDALAEGLLQQLLAGAVGQGDVAHIEPLGMFCLPQDVPVRVALIQVEAVPHGDGLPVLPEAVGGVVGIQGLEHGPGLLGGPVHGGAGLDGGGQIADRLEPAVFKPEEAQGRAVLIPLPYGGVGAQQVVRAVLRPGGEPGVVPREEVGIPNKAAAVAVPHADSQVVQSGGVGRALHPGHEQGVRPLGDAQGDGDLVVVEQVEALGGHAQQLPGLVAPVHGGEADLGPALLPPLPVQGRVEGGALLLRHQGLFLVILGKGAA